MNYYDELENNAKAAVEAGISNMIAAGSFSIVKSVVNAYGPDAKVTVELYFDKVYTNDYVEVIVARKGFRSDELEVSYNFSIHHRCSTNYMTAMMEAQIDALKLEDLLLDESMKMRDAVNKEHSDRDQERIARRNAIAAAAPIADEIGRTPTRWDKAVGRKVYSRNNGLGTVTEYNAKNYTVTIVYDIDGYTVTHARHMAKALLTWIK